MTDKDTIRELEDQAYNIRHLMDRLVLAYLGVTLEEIVRRSVLTANEKEECR